MTKEWTIDRLLLNPDLALEELKKAALPAAEPVALYRKENGNTWLQWLKSPDDYDDGAEFYAALSAHVQDDKEPPICATTSAAEDIASRTVEHPKLKTPVFQRCHCGIMNDVCTCKSDAAPAKQEGGHD